VRAAITPPPTREEGSHGITLQKFDRRFFVIGAAAGGSAAASQSGLRLPLVPTSSAAADGFAGSFNAWVVIRPDDAVRDPYRVPFSEMGQARSPVLAQLVAE